MRARAVIGSTLLLLSPLLASCGDDESSASAGDIIKARVDNQFKNGKEAVVALPTGRLLIHASKPVESASSDDTRTREKVDAPEGGVLVPISWQYDPWNKGRLDAIIATTDNPTVDLVADGDHYRLPPPQLDDDGGESFYVIVDGEAKARSLEIDFDGVTQTVNLANGRTDEGDAAALYDVDEGALKKEPCDEEQWFDSATVVAEFGCDRFGPVLTPYAAGKWAPEGSLWLAVTVQTGMRVYGVTNGLGGGARYTPRDVRLKPTIDGEKPAFVVSTDDKYDLCPVPVTSACGWSKHLIFEVPAEDGEQGPLTLDAAYRMKVAVAWGGYDAPKTIEVDATEDLKIWES